jgi:hypothetical protein
MVWVARAGLTARGFVYLVMGVLALLIARGAHAQVDQKGALAQVMDQPLGSWIVALIAIGLAGYSLWRISEAAFGVTGEGRKPGPRLKSLARGLIYAFLTLTAVSLLEGSQRAQAAQECGYAAQLMSRQGGRWLLVLVGLVVAIVGIGAIKEGFQLRFMRFFPGGHLPPRLHAAIRTLGRIGTIARGFVFTITGILVISAGLTHNAAKAGGLDVALKTLRDQPYGGPLLALVAIGLIIFGIYGLAEARYRRV